ncbi:MAG: LysM peptidoglycan-binding domain-containing protein [candidate division NC10 bacterium]|nr:LysM peptidoglycan-binding domain-containing protein [candidate division NC10 bacterium]
MGLRQHPGPLAILGFVLLTVLAAGCTLTPLPVTSFIAPEESIGPHWPTGLTRPTRESSAAAAPAPARVSTPAPLPPPALSPLALAMQRAGSHYERGLQAIRSGNADQAEWEFDAAFETLLDINLVDQAPSRLLGAARVVSLPSSPWLPSLVSPPRSLAPEPVRPAETEEPPLEAPALLGPEDPQAVTGTESDAVPPPPEPDTGKFDVPIVFNDQVKTFLQYFQSRKWGIITRAFERASRHLPVMRRIFRHHGLPEDLLNLAFIESAVNPRATSRAKAAGIWQFIPSTGRLYGMRSSWWLDERRDPEKSTHGAAEYLKNLYRMFESWPLALAAYNAGEGKIQKAIQRQRTRDFWSLRLPRETQLFVPAFMAMTIISREPERYGFSPPPEEEPGVETVTLRHPTDLKVIAQAARTTVEELRDLNPELIRWATPPGLTQYALRIPAGRRDELLEALDRIPPAQRVTWIRHHIRKGETSATIARRYGVDVQVVLEMNGLRKRQPLKVGGTLLIPSSPSGGVVADTAQPQRNRQAAPPAPLAGRYTVKKGDTLWDIARAHAVSPEDLRRWNNLPRDARLRPGQILKLARSSQGTAKTALRSRGDSDSRTAQAPAGTKRYIVRRGDTLWDIARAHAVSPEDLRRWNNLPRDARLRPGQALEIRTTSS